MCENDKFYFIDSACIIKNYSLKNCLHIKTAYLHVLFQSPKECSVLKDVFLDQRLFILIELLQTKLRFSSFTSSSFKTKSVQWRDKNLLR